MAGNVGDNIMVFYIEISHIEKSNVIVGAGWSVLRE